ncbi:putative rna exonuclease protein [Eutypa lata UCREL1]|uniref:Putative rna exonuclease protein n=1 Tax=Eutypa lata (strain UCR-EL1) TaxID=1287681 RepID=M7T7D3_EUTLA|nr:putative rna exonuclease protein [Eutypa lata UCREL1]
MGYTVYGMELIRLTAVSWPNGEELLDVLVQPVGETLDLNTRYSGVRAEDMVNAERWKPGDDFQPTVVPSSDPAQPAQRKLKLVPSPKAARDLLFSLMSPDTPLIGHGTENDLNAVRIVHPSVIDTVLLYPHKRGLPVRNGLKALTEMHLGRKIQLDAIDEKGVPEGHDSAEDARAAGDLVKLKVRDEWRKLRWEGWKLSDSGEFVSPGDEGWTIVGAKKGGGS